MSQVVFRSRNGKLRVSFDIPQFGFTKSFVPKGGQVVEAQVRWPDVKFFDENTGRFNVVALDPASPYVEMLRRHKCNQVNGGADFWEEEASTTDFLNWQSGQVQCQAPKGGLTDADRGFLAQLKAFRDKPIAPPKLPAAAELYNSMLPHFQVRGLAPLEEDSGTQITKARIVELLHALEKCKVWTPDATKAEDSAA